MDRPFVPTDAELEALLPRQFHRPAVRPARFVAQPKPEPADAVEAPARAAYARPEVSLADKLWEVGVQERFLSGDDMEVGSLLRQAASALRCHYPPAMFDPGYRDCCDTGACLED